jgi:hypothetical protein
MQWIPWEIISTVIFVHPQVQQTYVWIQCQSECFLSSLVRHEPLQHGWRVIILNHDSRVEDVEISRFAKIFWCRRMGEIQRIVIFQIRLRTYLLILNW